MNAPYRTAPQVTTAVALGVVALAVAFGIGIHNM